MLVLPFLFCFAYAAESYTAVPGGDQYGQISAELPEGIYTISAFSQGMEIPLFDSLQISYQNGLFTSPSVHIDILGIDVVMKLSVSDGVTLVYFDTGENGNLYWNDLSCVFTSVEKKTILDVVTDTLDIIISWCSIVLTSLLSGSLNPLLIVFAIPIALALIFLTVRVINSAKGRL